MVLMVLVFLVRECSVRFRTLSTLSTVSSLSQLGYDLCMLGRFFLATLVACSSVLADQQTSPGAGPVIVIETAKGAIEFETYPEDAPKTVAQIVALVRRGFYNGLRIHRAEPNFVIQMGDPQSRDMTKKDLWGTKDSGKPIGVAEISKKRPHKKGAVGMAHAGNAALADSQFYITLRATSSLDGRYTVFGQVIAGSDVVDKIEAGDLIKRMYVRGEKKP